MSVSTDEAKVEGILRNDFVMNYECEADALGASA